MDTQLVAVDKIVVTGKRRIRGAIQKLAEDIKLVGGLINPITVNKKLELIAGFHRLEAVKLLGWKEVLVRVLDLDYIREEIAQLDENLLHCPLSKLERCDQLRRRQELYEQLHPDAKAGKKRADGMNKSLGRNVDDNSSPTFAQDTASKMSISPRTVQREIEIAKKLSSKTKDILMSSSRLANNRAIHLHLSKIDDHTEQEAEVIRITKEGFTNMSKTKREEEDRDVDLDTDDGAEDERVDLQDRVEKLEKKLDEVDLEEMDKYVASHEVRLVDIEDRLGINLDPQSQEAVTTTG